MTQTEFEALVHSLTISEHDACLILAASEERYSASNSTKHIVSGSLLERVMLVLDDYLNAGCKETRKQAAEKAKVIYKEYYGVNYVNRNDR